MAIRAGIAIAAIFGIVVAIAVTPMIFNHYVSPLGRLRHDISIGDKYDSVLAKFEAYAERFAHDEAFEFVAGTTESDIFHGSIPATKQLFIYHVSAFDDVQLQVLFDEAGFVKEIEFIGD